MNRLLYSELLAWKGAARRKPLLLEGARQVGKTFLLKQFGQSEYTHLYYVNFDETPDLKLLFEGRISADTIIRNLSIHFQTQIEPGNSLIFFDEIQECDGAIASLKYFCEDAPQYHIAAAGSLLGVKLKGKKGFPVGKVTLKHLYPLSFIEFLQALDKSAYVNLITSIGLDEKVPEPFHQDLMDLLKVYFYVGGMPEAVHEYAASSDFVVVHEIQLNLLRAYELDFAKHASASDVAKISIVWDTIPSQLAKENKKFIYSVIKESARAREYESAIQWLVDAHLLLKSYQISQPAKPLKSYMHHEIFKTYLHDVGLLGAMSQLRPQVLLEKDTLFKEFRGAMTENYIAQAMTQYIEHDLFYWESDGKAEVDFVVDIEGRLLPIEVKAEQSKRKRSLQVYRDKYKPALALRVSSMNIDNQGDFINLPLYLMRELPRLICQGADYSITDS